MARIIIAHRERVNDRNISDLRESGGKNSLDRLKPGEFQEEGFSAEAGKIHGGSFRGNLHDPADAEGGMSHLLADLEFALIGFGVYGFGRFVGHDIQHVAGHLREELAGGGGAGKPADDPAGGLGED